MSHNDPFALSAMILTHLTIAPPHLTKLLQEFIIHTPTTLAQKYWITNGAVHAHWCAVFAQLMVAGVNHGIHAFLVRIRCGRQHGRGSPFIGTARSPIVTCESNLCGIISFNLWIF